MKKKLILSIICLTTVMIFSSAAQATTYNYTYTSSYIAESSSASNYYQVFDVQVVIHYQLISLGGHYYEKQINSVSLNFQHVDAYYSNSGNTVYKNGYAINAQLWVWNTADNSNQQAYPSSSSFAVLWSSSGTTWHDNSYSSLTMNPNFQPFANYPTPPSVTVWVYLWVQSDGIGTTGQYGTPGVYSNLQFTV